MRLEEACVRFNKLAGIRFKELFNQDDMDMIITNKGKTGQLLELALGIHLSSTNLDFEDGELKTNKCDFRGNPRETVFITQISRAIDELIQERPFEETHLYEKISNILYVPVCKDGSPKDWMFLPSIHIDLSTSRYARLRDIWRSDYYSICRQLKGHIETSSDGCIHTPMGSIYRCGARIQSHIIPFIRRLMAVMFPIRIMHSISGKSLFMIFRV